MQSSSHETSRPDVTDEITLPRGRLQPIHGWPLAMLGPVEEAAPGLLWRMLKTRPVWRQAVFAALGKGALSHPAEFLRRSCGLLDDDVPWAELLARFGDAVLRMRPREIVEVAFGECPDGFLGALDKLGYGAAIPPFYKRLYEFYASSDPEVQRRKRVLEQLPKLDDGLLDAANALDLDLLSPTVLRRAADAPGAEKLNEQARAILRLCSGETYEGVRAAIEAEDGSWRPCGWFERKLRNADNLLPESLPTDALAQAVRVTPRNMKRMALEYSNCLAENRPIRGSLLSGSFAMVALLEPKVLVELLLLDDGTWIAPRVHADRNGPVSRALMQDIRSLLEPLGVRVVIPVETPPELKVVKEALGGWSDPGLDWFDPA